jgi:hypothetical protein
MYGCFQTETFSFRKLWIMFVCVVWLLTRKILGSNLALVISFFEWLLCGFFGGLPRQMPELYFKLGHNCFFSHPWGICRPQGERIWHLSWNISLVYSSCLETEDPVQWVVNLSSLIVYNFRLSMLHNKYLGSRRLKMGLIACPETSVNNYQPSLCNIAEEHRPHILKKVHGSSYLLVGNLDSNRVI